MFVLIQALQELVDRFEFCIQLNQVQEDAKKTFFDGTNVSSRLGLGAFAADLLLR